MKSVFSFFLLLVYGQLRAQENYEIQVYGAPTLEKGATMLELHSNFTFGGQTYSHDGVLPTHNICHETIEITHGFTPWFETGFYLFNAIGLDNRTTIVGSHIRPRITAPENWHLPFGLSLSSELGYQKLEYSTDDWTLELRPIIDKTWKKFYVSFNGAFEKSLHGLNENIGFGFSPALKGSYNVTKEVALGFEYFGGLGEVGRIAPYQEQKHQLYLAIDIDFSPDWEFNAGYGLGFTNATDNEIFKVILGYKFHGQHKNKQLWNSIQGRLNKLRRILQ